ncbi:alpha-D-ribose 1-methylphosphonate 5-triphosphate diphosphatase [Shimia aestuarii]|uniref:alpha-D-ribose 1-methylphosphonate 5-triphosphate diphosphatase n=1 Tax=Shimia aestuarii TaxID=254406 RepID=UPI001FB3C2D4|nr:alpha-D-ribose 1-methylphosphonate 5-triphosphate diphosphatase [Shimia aestuarii]
MKFCNATLLAPDGFVSGDIALVEGKIAEDGDGREIDLAGLWVLPGMIDLHGDGFERHIAPRRGALKDLSPGLHAADAELASSGITTAMLAQFFSWEGGMRGPDFAERFATALREEPGLLTDMKLQLRLETHLLEDYARFEALAESSGAPYVVFNDHVPHDALAKGKRPPRLTGQALKAGRNPETHHALLQSLHDNRDAVPEAVSALASRLAAKGIFLGSHDDNSAEQRAEWRVRGARLSEFPETREAAAAAKAAGDAVVLGAPNVVRGNSHKGNVSATDLLREGLGDAIASDYHYPAMRQAVSRLVAQDILPFEAAWKLVSEGPADVLGFADRGRIEIGKRADLVVMDPETGRIGATFVAGKIAFMAGPIAARFLS